MVFSSISFLYYFLPIVLAVYFLCPKKFRNIVLLTASLLFYFYGESTYLILLLVEVFFAYIFGRLIYKNKDKKSGKTYLTIGVLISLSFLLIFKYADFFISNTNNLLKTEIPLLRLLLPIGISFYTFQIISYLIDIYRGTVIPQKNILNLGMYVSFFPQLIAGPIVRYETIEREVAERTTNIDTFATGMSRFIVGLGKKVIIANTFASFVVTFQGVDEKTVLFYWMYAIAATFQIYFDFSAYSDMAIGLGKVFGFNFLENFNYPYISRSITDFWRRWHISLSSWFRDYIYIPLGGSRTTTPKFIRNIFVVWFVTGFWHGADWNFIIWGLYFGVLLVIEKFLLKKHLDKLPYLVANFYTMLIVILGFVIFNATSLGDIQETFKSLFFLNNLPFTNLVTNYYLQSYFVMFIIGVIGSIPVVRYLKRKSKVMDVLHILWLAIIMITVTSYLIGGSYNPFIYFRF